MNLDSLSVGALQANCYILSCEKTGQAVIIDPGDEADKIKQAVDRKKIKVAFIANTHGHPDHVTANRRVSSFFSCPVYIHKADREFLPPPFLTGSETDIKDGDKLKIGELSLNILHTPGHSPGSISLICGKNVFTGDTLFAGGVGRTDLPGGDYSRLLSSIKQKLFALPDDYTVYPGHGPSTTIGIERKTNPFL